MKLDNVKYSAFAILNNDIVAHRYFVTEAAKNNWCNKQYRLHGENVIVEVWEAFTDKLLERWGA